MSTPSPTARMPARDLSNSGDVRPFDDLKTSGLLWLINASVFHPRGYAFATYRDDDGDVTGWTLLGDGSGPVQFEPGNCVEEFTAAKQALSAPGAHGGAAPVASTVAALGLDVGAYQGGVDPRQRDATLEAVVQLHRMSTRLRHAEDRLAEIRREHLPAHPASTLCPRCDVTSPCRTYLTAAGRD